MSLHDFWNNVRMGFQLIAPEVIVVGSPQLDANAFTGWVKRADLWLTPRSVDGFDEEDFSFLPEAERTQLAELVRGFRALASSVDPTAPAPQPTVEKAAPLFKDIVQTLDFNRYEDAEAYRLGKMIEQAITRYRRPELADLHFRTGRDNTGDPGLWIRVLLSDEASKTDDEFLKTARRLRDLLDPVARRIAPDRWPYLSFRALAEQSRPVEAS